MFYNNFKWWKMSELARPNASPKDSFWRGLAARLAGRTGAGIFKIKGLLDANMYKKSILSSKNPINPNSNN